jgi:uroporphyrinogen decarboxylase
LEEAHDRQDARPACPGGVPRETLSRGHLAGFPGVEITGSTIRLAQQNSCEHHKAVRTIVDVFAPDLVFLLMDLSVEANALGCYPIVHREESAAVSKDVSSVIDVERLEGTNVMFDSRLIGVVETVHVMRVSLPPGTLAGAYLVATLTLTVLILASTTRW